MRYLVLCCDYDGTLAHDGAIDEPTIAALEKFKKAGRKLVMVTGRELPDLQTVCLRLDLFDAVVAENGAVLYRPETRKKKLLAKAPPQEFIDVLRARQIQPLSVGDIIVATWEPHERTVIECIRDLGLELQVIFNKGAVMVLPAGVNKATGLQAALSELKLSPHNAVGIGDAENDHAFLASCECAVAVSNALPALQEVADFVTQAARGAGVTELIDEILSDDLASRAPKLERHHVLLGYDASGHEIKFPPQEFSGLLLGTSGSGKSTIATGLLERLGAQGYSYCVVDPEGDYEAMEQAIKIGSASRSPELDEVIALLGEQTTNVIVNLIALPFDDRPRFFFSLLAQLQDLRMRLGRPHWIVIDEAHHLLPPHADHGGLELTSALEDVLQITVHANLVAREALRGVRVVIATGNEPERMLGELAAACGLTLPNTEIAPLESGEAWVWRLDEDSLVRARIAESRTERRRHVRKYAEGELPEDRSFYFRGPEGKLNLRAQNLVLFLQMADGVDDATWLHHLRSHDYSKWMRDAIKDEELADEVYAIEDEGGDPTDTRKQLREIVEAKYTLPAASQPNA